MDYTESNENIIIQDDQDNNDMIFDINDRIFELRDSVSLDILSKNIVERFELPSVTETTNYVTKFKEKYLLLKEENKYQGDEDILNDSLIELSQLILTNLNTKFYVGIGDEIDSNLVFDINEYLEKIETLYEFFIVRRYTNIKDYFKTKLLQNKLVYVEKYKGVLDDKTSDDLFLKQNMKKFKDISDVIIIQFINDIINDIRSEITTGYEFFKNIVNLDLFEEFNNRMNNMLINYGNDFVVLDDHKAAESYLSLLDDDEIFVSLRNDLLTNFLNDAPINEKHLNG